MKQATELIKFDDKVKYNLEKSYEEALEDEKFKKLVSKLKLPKDTLMKYTSTLEDCALEYNNCLNCSGIVGCKNKINGYCYLPKIVDEKLNFNYQLCKYQKKINNDNKYLNNVYLFDIPKEIKEARMKYIYKEDKNRYETIKWLTTFIKSYEENIHQKGLFLHGNFGCGKTYLIAAMFNELAHKNIRSAIIFWPEFLRDLKASFSSDFKEKFDYVKKVSLLLIDDIGAESTTAWGRDEIFCPLIQYRMQEGLPTFFTSNLDINMLEEHFSVTKDKIDIIKSRRIIERINQMTDKIEMISKNLRN